VRGEILYVVVSNTDEQGMQCTYSGTALCLANIARMPRGEQWRVFPGSDAEVRLGRVCLRE
jgi:hypothetical protein